MKWMMVNASWCAACLIMKKRIRELQKEVSLEMEFLDVDYDDEALKGIDYGKILPVFYRQDEQGYHQLLIGEHSLETLRKTYHNAIS
jgi:thiol-disulfide isomerase/thioredoxin